MRALLPLLLLAAGCRPMPAATYGEQLFGDATFSESQFNTWSCATCHAVRPDDDRMLSGGTLVDVTNRPAWFGGSTARLIDAASFCYVYFMRSPAKLDQAEARSRALYEYLATLSTTPDAPVMPMTLVQNIADVPRGDPVRGEEVYKKACLDCHGERDTGKGRNSERSSLLPNIAQTYPDLFPGVAPGVVFVEKVRHGQFLGVGGNMPFFSKETLSDEDLGALLSHLGL